MQSPPPVEKAVSDAAWLLEQFERMQQSMQRASAAKASNDGVVGPWAIANRVCDRYQIPKCASVSALAAMTVL
jgi:hypothetical protein